MWCESVLVLCQNPKTGSNMLAWQQAHIIITCLVGRPGIAAAQNPRTVTVRALDQYSSPAADTASCCQVYDLEHCNSTCYDWHKAYTSNIPCSILWWGLKVYGEEGGGEGYVASHRLQGRPAQHFNYGKNQLVSSLYTNQNPLPLKIK